MIFGTLIGSKIFKSLSPLIWKDLGVNYKLLEFNPKKIKEAELFLCKNFDFFNITSPYKKKICKSSNGELEAPLGCNLGVCEKTQKTFYNTDILALNTLFKEYSLYDSSKILILGAGVMAQQILSLIFENSKASIYIHNRNIKNIDNTKIFNAKILDNIDGFDNYNFVVNTTPLQYTENNVLNLSYDKYKDGLSFAKKMLVYQAVYALNYLKQYDIVNNKVNIEELKQKLLNKISKKQPKIKKIWIIGFMGVGKTQEGKKLAQKLGFKFIDTDSIVEKEFNMTIKNIFETKGEKAFREKELEVLKKISNLKNENYIISTGGGAVLAFDKISFKDEDFAVWLQKDLKKINIVKSNTNKDRPLWDNKDIEYRNKLFKERQALYLKYADMILLDSYNLFEIFDEIIARETV